MSVCECPDTIPTVTCETCQTVIHVRGPNFTQLALRELAQCRLLGHVVVTANLEAVYR